jgi:kynurenine formamidase
MTGLLESVARGVQIYDLAQPLEAGMPCSPNHPGFRFALIRRHGDAVRESGLSGANELIVTGGHVGTHIDAICHAAQDGKLFGGHDAYRASQGGRFTVHGIDTVEPIFCRGVLLDVPGAKGVDALPPAYGVTPADLEAAAGDTPVGEGDAVLIRTGWPQRYHDVPAYVGHDTGVPGPDGDAAQWLADRRVRVAGSDSIAFEQLLPGNGHTVMPAHTILLTQYGINIIEVLNLEELARAGVREFLFVLLPLKITGGTGSPVRPIAVVGQ